MHPGLTAVIVIIAFTILSGCILVLRCISRFVIVRKAGMDDALAIFAYISCVATTCLMYDQYRHGLGQNIQNVSHSDSVHMLRDMWASIITYASAFTLIRASAILQFLRFLVEPKMRLFCWIVLVLFTAYGIGAMLATIFECQPIAFSWDHSIPGGKCIRVLALWYTSATLSIVTDIIVVAIPIIAVKNMTMPVAQKRVLIVVFALGGLGCIISVLRLHSIYVAATSTNYTRDNTEAAMLSAIEVNIGVICISLPPLKALVVTIWPNFLNSQGSIQASGQQPNASTSTELTLVSASSHPYINLAGKKDVGHDAL